MHLTIFPNFPERPLRLNTIAISYVLYRRRLLPIVLACTSAAPDALGVNLGNIAARDIIPLETLRLGLRGDTLQHFHGARPA